MTAKARILLSVDGAGQAQAALGKVEGSMGRVGSAAAGAGVALRSFAGVLAGALSVREYVQAADAVTLLQNRLKLATGSAQAAASAYGQLFDVAQRSRVSFTDLGTTYATIARSTKELGLSQRELMTVTEAIGNAMTVSGGSTESMNAALVQLGQGLGSGTLRGEELNSVMEQTPRLAQAIADGLGITLGKLREYAKDGKLTAETVTKALQSQASVLANEVQSSTVTVGQAMTVARNSATAFVGSIDAASGASSLMAQTIQEASRNLDALTGAFTATQAEASPLASMLGGAFAVAMETVSVLAVNVAYVFRQVRDEIGGMAAQAVAFMSLDFSGAAAIGRMMKEDAAKARAEVDATTARILSARNLAAVAATGAGQDEPRFARLLNPTAARVSAAPGSPGADAKRLADAAREAEKALTEERRRSADVVALRNKLVGEGFEAEQARNRLLMDMEAARTQAYIDSADTAAQRLQGMKDEADAAAYAEKYQVSLAIAIEETALARLREQQAIEMAKGAGMNDSVVLALQAEIDARRQLIGAISSGEVREASKKLRDDQAAEWAKTWDQVGQSFTDALMQGGKSVKQYLEGLFRTMVLRPLLAPITGAVGSVFGGPAAAGQASGAASGSGILSSLGSIGLAASAFGTGMAASFSSMMAAGVSGWATAAGSLIGTGSLAGIAAGVGMIAAPLAAAALLYKPLFGRKLKDTGIEGTFSGTDGLSANTYQFYKGGLFRSNKTTRSALDEGMRSGLAQQYAALTAQNATNAGALGLDAGGLANFSSSFGFSTNGMSEQQIGERFSQEFAAIADAQASLLLGTAAFNRAGESSAETLQRLAGSLVSVNAAFDALGKSALAGLQGADLASKLLDAFGGAEAFAAQTSAYYQAFYTQAERTATSTRQLTEALAGLGLALPESRTAFRELVEAQDLYTDAGRSTYAALIGLAPVFDQITQATEQMGKSLSDEVLRLRGLLTGSSVNSVGALQTDFAITTAAARAGDAGALERLPAISQALESAAALQAVTAADLALVRGQLTASLSDTMRTLGLDVPQFAVGTNYVPRDMIAKIHEGEAIIPKAYNPAAGGNDAMVAELRAVRAELEGLRAEVRADVGHNAKTARILERVTPDGTSLSTVVAA